MARLTLAFLPSMMGFGSLQALSAASLVAIITCKKRMNRSIDCAEGKEENFYSRVSNNRTCIFFLLKESFQSHVEHKIGTKTVYVIQQHQIVLLFKPYETEFSSMFI